MFQKGQPRPDRAGRKKGTVNRSTAAKQLCEELGIDPLKILLELCQSNDKHLKLQAAKEVCKYVYPQQKAIELNAEVDMAVADKVSEFEALDKNEKIRLLEENLRALRNQ